MLNKTLASVLAISLMTGMVHDAAAFTDTSDDLIVVSMGDSYSSGEGNEPYYVAGESYDELISNPEHLADFEAHRSDLAWTANLVIDGVRLGDHRVCESSDPSDSVKWYFTAASGAEIRHIYTPFEKTISREGQDERTDCLAPQLDVFYENGLYGKVDYVTLTLGGNDVGFTEILITSVVNSVTADLGIIDSRIDDAWYEFYRTGGVRDRLEQAYESIACAAGPQATIIVAGYPPLLADSQGTLTSRAGVMKINEAIRGFNEQIELLVNKCNKEKGMNIVFLPVYDRFEGHEADTDDAYINSFTAPGEYDLIDHVDPLLGSVVSGFSGHPNSLGQQQYLDVVSSFISRGYYPGRMPEDFRLSEASVTHVIPSDISPGDTVLFGTFGQEPIEWYVTGIDSGTATIISTSILLTGAFDDRFGADVSWKESALRTYLNGRFIETAFTEEERLMITDSFITSGEDAVATRDKIYIPDEETISGLGIDIGCSCIAMRQGIVNMPLSGADTTRNAYLTLIGGSSAKPLFWLRDTAAENGMAVCTDASFRTEVCVINKDIGVVPVMRVRLTDSGGNHETQGL